MMELKKKAVLNCSEAELGIALVPVIAPGVNDMQVGDILKFGLDHMLCPWRTFSAYQLFWQMFPEAPHKSHHHTKDAETY